MPVAYRTPGAYFEWHDSAPPAIDIPRTDVAGFAGIAQRGAAHRAVRITSWLQFQNIFGGHIAQGYLAYAVEGFFANAGRVCWVSRIVDPDRAYNASVSLWDQSGEVQVLATSPGTWANGARVRTVVRKGSIQELTITLPDGSETLITKAEFKSERTARAHVDSENLLSVPNQDLEPEFQRLFEVKCTKGPSGVPPEFASLSGGADGLQFLKAEHYFNEVPEFGLATLKDIQEISVVALPDLMPKLNVPATLRVRPPRCQDLAANPVPPPNVEEPIFAPSLSRDEIHALQVSILSQCHAKRYRFAIFDTPRLVQTPEQAISYGRSLATAGITASYGAVYFPWVLSPDPIELTGTVRAIPPSGHLAGVYARVDRVKGVHKPPANEVVERAADTVIPVDDIVHGELNDQNVNALRDSAGRGIRVMGARTLEKEFRLRYINVRRLLIMIEQALERQLQWTVHEPNNTTLWSNIDRVVRAFLERLFELGMLDGATSEEAYSVRCDPSTNQYVTEEGKAICEIGLQPPYPAEFVIVRIGVTRNGVQIEERGAQDA